MSHTFSQYSLCIFQSDFFAFIVLPAFPLPLEEIIPCQQHCYHLPLKISRCLLSLLGDEMARSGECGWIHHTRRCSSPCELLTQCSLYSQSSQKNLWRLGSNNQGEKSVAQEWNVVYSPFLDTCRHKQLPFLGALPQPKTHCKSTVPNLVLPDRRCTLEKNELP